MLPSWDRKVRHDWRLVATTTFPQGPYLLVTALSLAGIVRGSVPASSHQCRKLPHLWGLKWGSERFKQYAASHRIWTWVSLIPNAVIRVAW